MSSRCLQVCYRGWFSMNTCLTEAIMLGVSGVDTSIFYYLPPLLKKTGIQAPSLDSSAIDRVGWRTTCQTAVSALEASRPARRVQLRTQRHADLLLPLSITDTEYDCSFCDRMLRSRIRLISHEFTNNDIFGTMSMTSSSAPGDLLEQAVINEPL